MLWFSQQLVVGLFVEELNAKVLSSDWDCCFELWTNQRLF